MLRVSGARGVRYLSLPPRDPREVRLGLISRCALPHAVGRTGVTSLRYADLFTLTLSFHGARGISGRRWRGWGGPLGYPDPSGPGSPRERPLPPSLPRGLPWEPRRASDVTGAVATRPARWPIPV